MCCHCRNTTRDIKNADNKKKIKKYINNAIDCQTTIRYEQQYRILKTRAKTIVMRVCTMLLIYSPGVGIRL